MNGINSMSSAIFLLRICSDPDQSRKAGSTDKQISILFDKYPVIRYHKKRLYFFIYAFN